MKGKQMTGCWAKFTVSFSALLPVSRPAVLRKKGHGAMKWWFHQHRLSFTHTTRRLSATYLPSRPLVAPPPFICTASSFFFPFSQIVCSSTHRKILIARAIWHYLSSLPFFSVCLCVAFFLLFLPLSVDAPSRLCSPLQTLCSVATPLHYTAVPLYTHDKTFAAFNFCWRQGGKKNQRGSLVLSAYVRFILFYFLSWFVAKKTNLKAVFPFQWKYSAITLINGDRREWVVNPSSLFFSFTPDATGDPKWNSPSFSFDLAAQLGAAIYWAHRRS